MANALKNSLSTPLLFSIFLMEAAVPENSLPNQGFSAQSTSLTSSLKGGKQSRNVRGFQNSDENYPTLLIRSLRNVSEKCLEINNYRVFTLLVGEGKKL